MESDQSYGDRAKKYIKNTSINKTRLDTSASRETGLQSGVCPTNLFLLNMMAKSDIRIKAWLEKLMSMLIIPLRLAQVHKISSPLPFVPDRITYKSIEKINNKVFSSIAFHFVTVEVDK